MQLPFFYHDAYFNIDSVLTLTEESSRHIVQVLRMKEGSMIKLTNGKGFIAIASIVAAHKKNCSVEVKSVDISEKSPSQNCIAISLLKNTARFEWFLEKATELGIHSIIPLICDRTEKQHFRFDRMKNILISAMLQSQQSWLPEMAAPINFSGFISQEHIGKFYIAHCLDEDSKQLFAPVKNEVSTILIGPEGDFSPDEIKLAITKGYKPVSLGPTRLRTETAGIYAAVLMHQA